MADEIKAGSIVQLKSGGPQMTVTWTEHNEIEGVEIAYCEWFTQNKAPWKVEGKSFPITSLKLLEP